LKKFTLFLIIAVSSGIAHAEIYQWTDDQGTTHFSDKPINAAAQKVDIEPLPPHEAQLPTSVREDKTTTSKDNNQADSVATNKNPKQETAQEKANRNREEITAELIKAREIREAERKKQKQLEELEVIKCQEEKTKLALMKNEIKEYDKILKTMTRSDRPKSNEYIKWSDLNARINRQKYNTYALCN